MKRNGIIILCVIAIVLLGGIFYFRISKIKETAFDQKEPQESNTPTINHAKTMNVVLSLEDKISNNTAWCGTFNLIWNDLKNDLAGQDIIFTPQLEIVENLNKGTFNTMHLAEESYYKVYGNPNLELKKQIEKAIKEKFDETSDILDDFDWNNSDPEDYFLYAMLKKEFEFPKEFTELENGTFGNYENVTYFGIDGSTDETVRNQVEVLYYTSKEEFAVKLLTKNNDEVILVKGNTANTFGKKYEEILQKNKAYKGDSSFGKEDILQIPNMHVDLKEEIKEIQNNPFFFSNGKEYIIEKALQTIQFDLDKKGGKIKSEAGMTARLMSAIMEEPRKFLLDDAFTIFLIEQGKDLPYFAANISDITTVQKEARKIANTQASEEETRTFFGKVIEADLQHIIVEPNEGEEERNSSDKFSISLGENNDAMYEIGTNVKITYNGLIQETYPAQIEAIDIELKSAENFEIHFQDKQMESKNKIRTILKKTETEQYDYNIYAYQGEVDIVIDGKEMTLRDALLENKITMNEIIAKANQDLDEGNIEGDMYKEGGSMIYQYDTYTIIKVHNLKGNRDVYIGIPDMILSDLNV